MSKYGIYGIGYFGAELAIMINKMDNCKISVIYDIEVRPDLAKELINKGEIGKILYCHATRTGWENKHFKVS